MRQFIVDSKPDSKGLITIGGKDFKYIRQVLRLSVGDMIKVFSEGICYDATICTIEENKKKIILQLCDLPQAGESFEKTKIEGPEFYLLQFIPKPQKMELIIRQAVECGVSTIIPVIGEFTQKGSETSLLQKKSSGTGRQERIERIIREAMQQSGSLIETKVLEPMSLENALKIVLQKVEDLEKENKKSVLVSLYERNENSLTMHEAVAKVGEIDLGVVAVGCEGGISPTEIKLLNENGFNTIHFDINILRCETASLYGVASLQTTVLESKKWKLKE